MQAPADIQLRKALIKSAAVHICVFLLLIIAPGFGMKFKDKPLDVVWVEIPKGSSEEIGLGIKETKTLPTTTVEQQKQTVEQKPLTPEIKPKVEQKQPVVEKSVTSSVRMRYTSKTAPRAPVKKTDRKIADALASIDKSLKERATPESAQTGQQSDGYKYGTGDKPIRVAPSDPEYIKYQAQVRGRIIGNWIVPERFASEGTSARASLIVMINMEGEVVSVRWAKQSNIASFDESAKRAVEKASPLPRPPERMAWETYNEGFLIEFDARVR